MQQTILFAMGQQELATRISADANDESNNRWTVPQVYRGMNNCLSLWGNRVLIPRQEGFPEGGYGTSTNEYALPNYMDGFVDIWIDRSWSSNLTDVAERWEPLRSYRIYYREDGVRVMQTEYDMNNSEGRIIFWSPNSSIPTDSTLPTLNAGIDADDTTLVLASIPVVSEVGHVRIEQEWISYAGISNDGSNVSLLNLKRGQLSTTAASHSSGATVEWGIVVHRMDLYQHMTWETLVYLHMQYMNRASGQERSHHFDQVRYYKQIADEKWMRIPQSRPPSVMLSRDVAPYTVRDNHRRTFYGW